VHAARSVALWIYLVRSVIYIYFLRDIWGVCLTCLCLYMCVCVCKQQVSVIAFSLSLVARFSNDDERENLSAFLSGGGGGGLAKHVQFFRISDITYLTPSHNHRLKRSFSLGLHFLQSQDFPSLGICLFA